MLTPPMEMMAGAAAVCFIAGFIRAYSGFGFALAGVPLMTQVLEPAQAVPMVLLLEVPTGLYLGYEGRALVDWGSVKLLMPATLLATPIGMLLLKGIPPDAMRLGIAALVLTAVGILATGWRVKGDGGRGMAVGLGFVAGLLNGSTAMCGPPVLFYFLARGLPPAETRASMLMFFIATGLLALGMAFVGGLMPPEAPWLFLAGMPALFISTVAGRALFQYTGGKGWRPVALAMLALIGVETLVKAVVG